MRDIVERLRAGICGDPCKVKDARSGCECDEAAREIERLRKIRENLGDYMPTARPELVDEGRCCVECGGSGIKTYGTSATWRSGSGGMTITGDVCNRCWGSGDAHKPWPSHRTFERLAKENPS